MKTKEMKIQIPEGYEIDMENSTFECIKFKPKKLTYDDVAIALFNKEAYIIDDTADACISYVNNLHPAFANDSTNCCSKKQVEKILALNKLINVAKYLNGDWIPSETDAKYILKVCNHQVTVDCYIFDMYGGPCFKSIALANQAIEILGEETIGLALSYV